MLATLTSIIVLGPGGNVNPIRIDGYLAHPRYLLAKIDGPVTKQRIRKQLGLRLVRDIPQIGYVVVETPRGKLRATKKRLEGTSGVMWVDYDKAGQVAYTPNDPLYPSQWSLTAMQVSAAWDQSFGSTPILVAVLDTGVRVTHTDLAPNIWVNPGEIAGNGIDDESNGYIDDVNGYDFAYDDNNPDDDHGHGTMCSGVIGAVMDNSTGMTGVARNVRIMAMKSANSDGYFYDDMTVPSYIYAADNGAKIFSCSFFTDRVTRAERDALVYAENLGVLTIVAAGNANTVIPHYPAAYEEVMAVSASSNTAGYLKASFSNFGSWVDVAAPGVSVHVTTLGGGYGTASGTSFACPNTAGVAALLWSANPSASASQIRNAIEDTATFQFQAPFGEVSNYGHVNANAAMTAILTTPAPRRPAAFRYMTPVGGRPDWDPNRQVARIYGRGFQSNAAVVLRQAGRLMRVLRRGRNFVEFYNNDSADPIDLYVDGALVYSVRQPVPGSYTYPLIEAATQSATLTGGFDEALMDDGVTFSCTRRSDGIVKIEGTFNRVKPREDMKIRFKRHYTGTVVGTETVYLYDWTSNSYPYGNWVELNVQAVPTSPTMTEIAVPEAWRYLDYEGTAYILVQTSNDLTAGAEARVDQLNLGY